MLLHSETYRVMTEKVMAAADELCGGRICVTHEGGYSEAYAPFCGHALLEALSGHRTAVVDPALEMIELWQPVGRTREFQLSMVAEIAARLAETGAA
jgi:acetoin utilization deacetylase AcuC-like enzyme